MMMNYVFFGAAVILWALIAVSLALNPDLLREFWHGFRARPLVVQGVGWVLLLPWVAAAWLWQLGWPVWLRLLLIVGIAWANLNMFYPRAA